MSAKADFISTAVTSNKLQSGAINHLNLQNRDCSLKTNRRSEEPNNDSQVKFPLLNWRTRYRHCPQHLSPSFHCVHDAPDISIGSQDNFKPDSEVIAINSPYLRQFVSQWRPFRRCLLLRPTPLSSDIVQGLLGNCWFLSALALVAERPELLRAILPTSNEEFEQTKRATVRLFKSGRWYAITLDNTLPVNSHQQLVFSQSKRKQLFVPLIEKALAKLYGGYDQLRGGLTSEGMTLLTGFPCQILWLPPGKKDQKLSEHGGQHVEELWIKFLSYYSAGFLIGVSCGRHHEVDVTKTEYKKMGLLKEHAYSVLEVISTENIRLVKLRNPWGSKLVWNGNWSDRSALWTPALRSELVPEGSEEGIFWISFADLCRYFEMAIVCKTHLNWFQYAYEGPFTGDKDPSGWTVYELQIDNQLIEDECTQAEVTATLYQDTKGSKKTPNRAIFLVLFELLNSQSTPVIGSFVSSSICNSQGAVTLEAELKRQKRYMLGVFAFNDWHQAQTERSQCQYVLRINSSKGLLIDCFTATSVLLGDMIIHFVKTMGVPIYRQNITAYQLNTNWAGLVSVVENHDSQNWLKVSMTSRTSRTSRTSLKPTTSESSQTTSGYSSAESLSYSQTVVTNTDNLHSQNHREDLKAEKVSEQEVLGDEDTDRKYLASTRNSLLTKDLIPPLHCQLINIITNQFPITDAHISIKLNFRFQTFEKLFHKKMLHKGSKPMSDLFHKPSIHDQASFLYGFHCPRAVS